MSLKLAVKFAFMNFVIVLNIVLSDTSLYIFVDSFSCSTKNVISFWIYEFKDKLWCLNYELIRTIVIRLKFQENIIDRQGLFSDFIYIRVLKFYIVVWAIIIDLDFLCNHIRKSKCLGFLGVLMGER